MAMYVNAEQDRWARQNARANGQQATQPASNYTGVTPPPADGPPGSTPGPRDPDATKRAGAGARYTGQAAPKVYTKAAQPTTTPVNGAGVRTGTPRDPRAAFRPTGGVPINSAQQPQVRDRAFSMGEQQYRAGPVSPLQSARSRFGAGNEVVTTVGKPAKTSVRTEPVRTGSVPGMSGPAAAQPTLTSALPVGWSAPNQQSTIPTGMQYSGPQLAGPPGSNPTDGMSVLGPSGQPMSEGGAGTAGPGYNDVQTRRDSQTPLQWAEQAYQNWSQNAQDNAAGNEENNATYTGAQGSYTPSDNPEEAGTYSGSSKEADATAAAGQGDAALERELNRLYPNLSEDGQPFTLNDYQGSFVLPEGFFGGNGILPNPNPNGNESPATDLATWLATMIGEPFGAAATKLNKYGR